MNSQLQKMMASSMSAGGLANVSSGIKPGEFQILSAKEAPPSHFRTTRILTGKAVLIVDAVIDIDGNRAYDTNSRVKTARTNSPNIDDDALLELNAFGTSECVVPNQCKRMGIGDRWHVDVVYKITYTPTCDHEGNEDWEVVLEFLKAKTLNKSPWNEKRHRKYVSKAKRKD